MAMFKLEFDMGNAAFDDGNAGTECHDILIGIAGKCEEGYTSGFVYDSNGNRIGAWEIKP